MVVLCPGYLTDETPSTGQSTTNGVVDAQGIQRRGQKTDHLHLERRPSRRKRAEIDPRAIRDHQEPRASAHEIPERVAPRGSGMPAPKDEQPGLAVRGIATGRSRERLNNWTYRRFQRPPCSRNFSLSPRETVLSPTSIW